VPTRKIKQILLLLGDTVCLYLSLYLVLAFRYGVRFGPGVWQDHLLPFTAIFVVWLIVFYIGGFYGLELAARSAMVLQRFFRAMLANGAIAISVFYLTPDLGVAPKTNLFLVILFFSLLFAAWRLTCGKVLRAIGATNNLLLIGVNSSSLVVARKVLDYPELGYKLAAVVNPRLPASQRGEPDGQAGRPIPHPLPKWLRDSGATVTGDLRRVGDIVQEKGISTIVVCNEIYPDIFKDLYELIPTGINFHNLSSFWEEFDQSIPVYATNEIWFLENLRGAAKRFYEARKRVFDVFGVLLLLPAVCCLLPFVALAIKFDGPPGPILYRQKRVGKDGKLFEVIKFRTMIPDAEKNGRAQWAKENDPRVTRVGRFLRAARLDELPQLINVLRGEMSFIGPRPERPEFVKTLAKKIPHYHLRHLIRPGLTGWAQINYPYGSSVGDAAKKLRYDLYYLKRRSLLLDAEIVLKTIAVVFSRKGR